MSFRVGNDIVINASNLTTTDEVSEILDCANIYGMSIHAISTGTISGSVEIEVSNDKSNWVQVASPSITISDATNDAGQLTDMFFRWARVRYSATSGSTNTLEVHVTTKGI